MLTTIEDRKSVRIISLNHKIENRYSGPFLEELHVALDDAEMNDKVRAIVITGGREKFFSNGLDLEWAAKAPMDQIPRFLELWTGFLARLCVFPKPFVAAINGHAIAGGLFTALCADWRVMNKDKGWLCIPEIDLGLDLPPGNIALVAHVIGARHCERLSLTGERIDAAQALEIGMIDEAVGRDMVVNRAIERAAKLADKNPDQFARHKKLLKERPARALAEEDLPFLTAYLDELAWKLRGGE